MNTNRKCCGECPWKTTYRHSESWKGYVDKMTQEGYIQNGVHKCHMIDKDTWAFDSPIDEKNVCIGSLKINQ